jgi:hypothetical protein
MRAVSLERSDCAAPARKNSHVTNKWGNAATA